MAVVLWGLLQLRLLVPEGSFFAAISVTTTVSDVQRLGRNVKFVRFSTASRATKSTVAAVTVSCPDRDV